MEEKVLQIVDRIGSFCKDRHASLREACNYAREKFAETKNESDMANLLFYPLQIASNVTNEQTLFLLPALEGIASLIKHRLISKEAMYIPPDVPLPIKKKGIFSTTDITAPGSQRGLSNGSTSTQHLYLIDVIIDVLSSHRRCFLDGVAFLELHCLVAIITEFDWVSGERLIRCFQGAFDAQVEVRPLCESGVFKSLLPQMITTLMRRQSKNAEDVAISLETKEVVVVVREKENQKEDIHSISDIGRYNFDCYLILVRVCELSVQNVNARSTADSLEWRAKKLSCVLLSHFFHEMSKSFVQTHLFQQALHEKVTVSLLRNCALDNPDLHRLALGILHQIVVHHRALLKSKVIVFLLGLLLPLVESQSTSFYQKHAILKFFESTLREPQVLVDWFVNFDCVPGVVNICECLISRLSKLTKTCHPSQWITPKQNDALCFENVKALSAFVRSLEVFSRDFNILANSPGEVGEGEGEGDGEDMGEEEQDDENDEDEDDDNSHNEEEKKQEKEGSSTGNTAEEELAESNFSASNTTRCPNLGIEQLLWGKRSFDRVVDVFNTMDPADAVRMAIEFGFAKSNEPSDVARFLLRRELDAVCVGQYISKNDEERKSILRAFIGLNDFTGMMIDEAMRLVLGKFKLPGEAQVVDRAMEIFAEEYCLQNPTAFSGPSPAFILAFSIMILNTDAHSSHVAEKMKLEQFIRNNSGIDDGKDLPLSLLEGIYRRVTAREIVLERPGVTPRKPIKRAVGTDGGSAHVKLRRLESEQLVEASLAQITQDVSGESFTSVNSAEIAGAMLDSTWTALLAAFAIPLEEIDNMELIDTCLEGIECAIKISCRFACRTERTAFISALLAFTHLTNLREIEYKSVKSIVVLIRIALEEGDHLGTSWYEILRCISLIAKLQMLAEVTILANNGTHATFSSVATTASVTTNATTNSNTLANFTNTTTATTTNSALSTSTSTNTSITNNNIGNSNSAAYHHHHHHHHYPHTQTHQNTTSIPTETSKYSMSGNLSGNAKVPLTTSEIHGRNGTSSDSRQLKQSSQERIRLEIQNAGIVAKHIDDVEVHRLFSRSNQLSDTAVVDLVEALSLTSVEELAESPPRTFSLEKLAEVTEVNIWRLRYVWSKMWTHVSRHFVKVALGTNQIVAMFVVDHLRRLTMKFLSRDELGNFNFQRDVLKPFEMISAKSHSSKLKELIVDSLGQMVEVRSGSLGSGWGALINTLVHCVKDELSEDAIRRASLILQSITLHCLHLLNFPSDFLFLVKAWTIIGHSTAEERTTRPSVWFIYFIMSNVIKRDQVTSLISPNKSNEKIATCIKQAEETKGVKGNSSEPLFCISADEIRELVSTMYSDNSECTGNSCDMPVSDKVVESIGILHLVSMGSLASLVMTIPVSGDAMEALVGIFIGPLRYNFNSTLWWRAIGNAVSPALEFIAHKCTMGETQSVCIPLLRKAVDVVVQLIHTVIKDSIPESNDRILYLFRHLLLVISISHGDDRVADIGYIGVRHILRHLDTHGLTESTLWESIVTFMEEAGSLLMKNLEEIWQPPMYCSWEQQSSATPVLLMLITHVKSLRSVALAISLPSLCRSKIVTMLLHMLLRVMVILRSRCDRVNVSEKSTAYRLALFITLERSICNVFFDIEEHHSNDVSTENNNTLWSLIIEQFATVVTGTSDTNHQESTSLRGLVRHFLDLMLQVSPSVMLPCVDAKMPQLCQLIVANDAALATPLGNLFLRYYTQKRKEITS